MIIKKHSVVYIKYSLFLKKEEIFQENIFYLHGGYKDFFEEVELALDGKNTGYCIDGLLLKDYPFGEEIKELLIKEKKEEFFKDTHIGDQFELEPLGEFIRSLYTVVDIDEFYIYLNGNHPLAGLQEITVNVKVLNVRPASEIEIKNGFVSDISIKSNWKLI